MYTLVLGQPELQDTGNDLFMDAGYAARFNSLVRKNSPRGA